MDYVPDDCGGFFDVGGLCCPDDPLDTVMENLGLADDAYLEELGIQVAPSPPPLPAGRGGDDDAVLVESEAVLPTPILMDLGSGLDAPLLPALDVCGLPFPMDMMASCGGGEPLFPADDVCGLFPSGTGGGALLQASLASPVVDTSCTESLAVCLPSPSTTWATEVPAFFPLLELDSVVPRKNRSTPANRRRNKSWSPKPNFLLDDGAPRTNTNNNPGSSGRGGNDVIRRRRRGVPRQRNRQSQRVCSHCERSDTPQWRAGPKGPGTLCNACGIRYGMGKLHDEYRPTTSPTFRSDKHSNRHRKVMKLKANKEATNLMAMVPMMPGPGAYMSAACQ